MTRKSHGLMVVTFLYILMCVLVTPARSQAQRRGEGQGRGQGQRSGRGQATLPDGPDREEVQMQCTKCHALGLIANASGNTKQEWADLLGTMVKLPNDQREAIVLPIH